MKEIGDGHTEDNQFLALGEPETVWLSCGEAQMVGCQQVHIGHPLVCDEGIELSNHYAQSVVDWLINETNLTTSTLYRCAVLSVRMDQC